VGCWWWLAWLGAWPELAGVWPVKILHKREYQDQGIMSPSKLFQGSAWSMVCGQGSVRGVYPGWQVVVAGLGGGPRIGIARGWWGKPGPPREG